MSKEKVQKKGHQIKITFGELGESRGGFNMESLMEQMGLELDSVVRSAGMLMMEAIMREETEMLAGRRHDQSTVVDRWGSQPGYAMLGGQKVPIQRPRLRQKEGSEVSLESYRRFQQNSERTQAVYQRMAIGVSCRNYPEAIEAVRDGYGISKSVVSREIVESTGTQLRALLERDLSTFDLRVLLIDGVRMGDAMFMVALGVDSAGNKQVMGFREAANENSEVGVHLLEDLVQRGLQTNKPILCVIDGSKGLRLAIKRFFGSTSPVQRCQVHKLRNVLSHLPDKYHSTYRRKIKAAYQMKTYTDAERALQSIIKELNFINHSAAESLAEGLEETLTMHTLDVPPVLRTSLASTNLIESTFARSRSVMRNVKHWKNSSQRQRWLATALVEAEKKFRRVRGYRSMSVFLIALDAWGLTNKQLDSQQLVA